MLRRLPLAVLICGTALAQSPADDGEARRLVAEGRASEALAAYQELAGKFPHVARYEDQIGFILAATRQTNAAIPHFERAIAIDRTFAPAHYHLGVAFWLTSEKERAIEPLRRAAELSPESGD